MSEAIWSLLILVNILVVDRGSTPVLFSAVKFYKKASNNFKMSFYQQIDDIKWRHDFSLSDGMNKLGALFPTYCCSAEVFKRPLCILLHKLRCVKDLMNIVQTVEKISAIR